MTPLEEAKIARNTARKVFRAQLAQVQEDLSARSVGGRIVDRAAEAAGEAAEVANEHKAVVAGTIAAIAVWFLWEPIVDRVRRWAGEEAAER
jgi:hypothetical protein